MFSTLFLTASLSLAYSPEMCFNLLKVGDYQRALEVGKMLLNRAPNDFSTHKCLSDAYYELGDYRASLSHAKNMKSQEDIC
ncbi:MAG: hypothetical protein D6674_03565 [Acidobacteria bacterium]|jgi:tetratricopeptide (TPR) repeat protein|nr:MAG: hypothetical protein D6674_03565 [Acidobacteriota bacterium]